MCCQNHLGDQISMFTQHLRLPKYRIRRRTGRAQILNYIAGMSNHVSGVNRHESMCNWLVKLANLFICA